MTRINHATLQQIVEMGCYLDADHAYLLLTIAARQNCREQGVTYFPSLLDCVKGAVPCHRLQYSFDQLEGAGVIVMVPRPSHEIYDDGGVYIAIDADKLREVSERFGMPKRLISCAFDDGEIRF